MSDGVNVVNFEIDAGVLASYLKLLVGTVEANQVMQILAHVHFAIRNQRLIMTTSNTEMEVSVNFPIEIPCVSEVAFTVSARKLAEIIRVVDLKHAMKWSWDGSWVHLSMGKVQYRLATLDADRFPFLLISPQMGQVSIKASLLRRLIDQTVFSVAKQDIRIYLNGLLLDLTPGMLTAVASDSHRMSLRSSDLDQIQHEVMQAILPRRTALELSKLLATIPEGESVALSFSDHLMVISYGVWTLRSHLIEAKYPPYRRIMLKDCRAEISLPVLELRNALTRMGVCSNDRFRGVQLLFENNCLLMKSQNFDQEEAQEEIGIEYPGPAISLSIGLGYLLEAVSVMNAETVIFKIGKQEQGVMLVPDNDAKAVYMIMSFTA